MANVTVVISGPVGSGKSAVLGEIEIALKAIGLPVRYADPAAARSEKNMTHADWQRELDRCKPSVVLMEAHQGSGSGHPGATAENQTQ